LTLIKLFENYIRNGKKRVKIENVIGEYVLWRILGSILFLIFINDIFKFIRNGSIVSYANDTVILFSNKNREWVTKIT